MSASSSTEDAAARSSLARALFRPGAIALIGASDDPSRLASRPLRLLRRHGYEGRVVPIHPLRTEIDGEPAYRSLGDVPGGVDHAFVMVPVSGIERAIEDCCAAGVKVTTVLTGGFAESGAEGAARQAAMVAAARKAGMRVLGPNSLGVVSVADRVAISANAVLEHEPLQPGALSVVSQSGSMLGAILTRAQERGLGLAKLVSTGNECDIALGELVHLLVDDAQTRAILLFLEAFRDADVLARAARRAFAAGKPVIAFKVGRSAAGRAATATHTGAIAGDDRAAEAFLRAHGILRVDHFEALIETAQLVLGHRPPAGRRLGTVTVSGGAAAMVLDRLGLAGIEPVPPPAAMVERLAARRVRIRPSPVIDLPMGRADGGSYAAVLNELLASDHCDVVLAVLGSNATHAPQSVHERILAASRGPKPLAVFAAPRARRALALLQAHGVAAFRTPESCAAAIAAYCDWREPVTRMVPSAQDREQARKCMQGLTGAELNALQASRLLARLGIAFAPACAVQAGTDRVDVPFPVAAKILSPDIAHSHEVGGVALDIPDPAALAETTAAMLERVRALRPHARIDGVLVQTMQRGVCELLAGFRRDPQVGPVVAVGLGGVLAEHCGAPAIRLAPVDAGTAAEMIAEVRALARLRDARFGPSAGLEAAAQAIHRLSLLACEPAVLEAEINPLVVSQERAVAVDALVRLAEDRLSPIA